MSAGHFIFIPAVLLVALVYFLQRRRVIRRLPGGTAPSYGFV